MKRLTFVGYAANVIAESVHVQYRFTEKETLDISMASAELHFADAISHKHHSNDEHLILRFIM